MEILRKAKIGKVNYYRVGFPFYEIMSDGVYIGMSNGCMLARKRFLTFKEGNFPLVSKGKEGFELVVPKIPFKYWNMVWKFYRDVNEMYGCEATVLFYWNYKNIDLKTIPDNLREEYGDGLYVDGKLVLYVPKQINSKTLTSYHNDSLRVWLGDNLANFLDTHSHNSMGAFFSSTDDDNEKRFQFYSVFGRLGSENECIMRYRFQGEWKNIDVFDVFEKGHIPEGDKKMDIEYPKEWYNQCKFRGHKRET